MGTIVRTSPSSTNRFQYAKAFTVIELILILAIFAVFTAVAILKYNNLTQRADEATVKAFTCILRAAATITYANVALGNVPDSTVDKINITSVYNNLEDKGGLQISDNNYFTATINGKRYRWRFTPPLTVDDGAEY
jgi:type II secretory pathway pseudopilin PulG